MADVRTLIVLGSSLTALAVVRAAHRTGLRCVMLDNRVGPGAATRAAKFRRLSSDDMAGIVHSAADFAGRDDVAVIADSDRWVRFVRSQGDSLEAQGWLVLHPDAAALEVCLDKSAFLKWCSERNLDAPRHHHASTIEHLDRSAYPLMLRPEWTQHSSATHLPKAIEVREPAQMKYWLGQFAAAGVTPSICESLLRHGLRQFSVGAARNAAGRVRTFLAEKVRPHAEQCAGGTFVAPAAQAGIEDLATQALHALNFFGVAEVEILYDPKAGRAYLVEINARPWLQYGLPFACGCDLLGHVLGRQSKRAGTPGRNHAWLYFYSDLYTCFSRSSGLVSSGKIGFMEYLRSAAAADVHATWDWRDPMPLLAATSRTAGAWLRRLLRLR